MKSFKSLFIQSILCDTVFRNYYRTSNALAIVMLGAIIFFSHLSIVFVSSFVFNLMVLGIRKLFQKSRDPFVLLFLTFSLIFIEFPIAIMAICYPLYFPSSWLSFECATPAESTIAYALGFLFTFYLCFFATVIIVPVISIDTSAVPRFSEMPKVLPVAILMLVFSFAYDNFLTSFFTGFSPGMWIEILKFLGYDIAIFFMLFLIVNLPGANFYANTSARREISYGALCVLFIGIHSYAGSKGAILILFFIAFIYPLAVLGQRVGQKIYVPHIYLVFVGLIVSPIFFFIASAIRILRKDQRDEIGQLEFIDAFRTALSVDNMFSDQAGLLFKIMSDRISAPFNRYVLIFENYDLIKYSETVKAFPTYIFHSFLNLHLPGTPFPDAYNSSSMQLESILLKTSFISSSAGEFNTSRNNQPFSIFGLVILLVGFFSPLLFFIFVLSLRWICSWTNFLTCLFCLMFFNSTLHCYGVEASFQVSLSIIATFWVLKSSQFKLKF